MKLIVGLGNPGKEYEETRHNTGFALIDNLQFTIDKLGNWRKEGKFKSLIVKTTLDGQEILLAKPQTFMNSSGEAVSLIANYFKIDPANILVIHDDLDIPLGTHKLQFGKGPVGHNGILDIEHKLGTKDFWRVRVGVDNRGVFVETHHGASPTASKAPPLELTYSSDSLSGEEYVLAKFTTEEFKIIESETPEILAKIRGWVTS